MCEGEGPTTERYGIKQLGSRPLLEKWAVFTLPPRLPACSLTMLPESHFLLGGVLSSVLAVVGTVLNLLAMMVLVDVRLRSNPTTILVIFLTITNTIYTALVLPFNSATLLNRAYFSNHNLQCKVFAFIFYLNQVRAVEHSDDDFDSKAWKILLDGVDVGDSDGASPYW